MLNKIAHVVGTGEIKRRHIFVVHCYTVFANDCFVVATSVVALLLGLVVDWVGGPQADVTYDAMFHLHPLGIV